MLVGEQARATDLLPDLVTYHLRLVILTVIATGKTSSSITTNNMIIG